MKRNTLARLALALCAAAALMLTGCGGDDGVSPSTHEDLQMDHDELVAALASRGGKVADLPSADRWRRHPREPRPHGATHGLDRTDCSADEPTSLLGMLAAEQAQVMMLTQQIDGDGTPENPGLTQQLADAMARIGSADEPTSLLGMLAAEQAQVMMLTQQIDGDGTPENPGLTQQLADAMARIVALEGGTAPDVLDPIKDAAGTAMTEADTAAAAADMAADAAEEAAMNRASIQTGDANSATDAYMARMQANAAATAAADAKTHSDLAQAAMNTEDAAPHRTQAEAARGAA